MLTEGDMGRSFAWRAPVSEIIMDRLWMTLLTGIGSTIIVYLIAKASKKDDDHSNPTQGPDKVEDHRGH